MSFGLAPIKEPQMILATAFSTIAVSPTISASPKAIIGLTDGFEAII